MSKRVEMQCFNKLPHYSHNWEFFYNDPPTEARCPGIDLKLNDKQDEELGELMDPQITSISKQLTDQLDKRLLTIFGSETNLKEIAKYYVLEEGLRYPYVSVSYEPETTYSFTHEVKLRKKADWELKRDGLL